MLDVACGSNFEDTRKWANNDDKWKYTRRNPMACLCENSRPDPAYNEILAELVTESPGSSQKCNPLYEKVLRSKWAHAEYVKHVCTLVFTIIPGFFLLVAYLHYVCKNLDAPEAHFLGNMWSVEQLEEFVRKAKKVKPDVNFTIECYHEKRRHRDDPTEYVTSAYVEAKVKINSWRDNTATVDEMVAMVRARRLSSPPSFPEAPRFARSTT